MARSWATPMVATVRISRGERKNRRMITNSMTPPSTMALITPAPRARNQDHPEKVTMPMASTVGAVPRSAWAKLRMRLARYTSARPTAMRAFSSPNTMPDT